MNQVRQRLDAINQAWRERRCDALNEFFDENIVIRGPGLKEACRGREAAIHSYVQFLLQSHVIEYAESNHAIDIWGDIAVATYDWVMTFEQKGQTKTDRGHDMFVFSRSDSKWLAVFRLILF